jgi:hypothetical protein
LEKVIQSLTKGDPVDWNQYSHKDLISYLNYYIQIKWCKKIQGNDVEQFKELSLCLEKVNNNIFSILDSFILRNSKLRLYMIIHSVFPATYSRNRDWLQRYMAERLVPTESELRELVTIPDVPKDILDKLSGFDPEVIQNIEVDNIRIEYDMYAKYVPGKKYINPINIIDLDWDFMEDPVNVEKVLSSVPTIDLSSYSEPSYASPNPIYLTEDDLPF